MTNHTIIDVLFQRAEEKPDVLAYDIEGDSVTYGQLLEEVQKTAGNLSDLGLKKGDRCALILGTGLDLIRFLFAVQLLRATPAILNPALSAETLNRRIDKMRSHWVIAQEPVIEELKTAAGGRKSEESFIVIGQVLNQEASNHLTEKPVIDPEETAFFQFTSGTTGEPRIAVLSHKNLVSILSANLEKLGGIRPDDIAVTWVPLHHDMGLVRFVFGPLFFGCPCYLLPPTMLGIKNWLSKISDIRGTLTGGPDFAYRIATRMTGAADVNLTSLRYGATGGEMVRKSTIDHFESKFNLSNIIHPGYGLAESTLAATLQDMGDPLHQDKWGNVSCGTPCGDIKIRIINEAGRPLPAGKEGEILLKGASIFSGYFEDKEATTRTLQNGWLHTGDIGLLDKDGHLYVLGRLKAMIKRSGQTIIPREIEEVVDQLNGIRFSVAIGLMNKKEGGKEELIVIAEIREKKTADLDGLVMQISETVKKTLGSGPDNVLLVSAGTIPRSQSGKIKYNLLREIITEGTLNQFGEILSGQIISYAID
jgi:acyl-CoA synthetase (AMP-forming)/AMP-acid ligase II